MMKRAIGSFQRTIALFVFEASFLALTAPDRRRDDRAIARNANA
ncbi:MULTISPECIES: hypothetical protein [unclassified Microcoleus]